MESTAHYHRILEQHLRRIGVNVTVINPIQSGSLKNLEIRKIKSDRTDAKRLAQMYLFKMFRQNYSDSANIRKILDMCTHVAVHPGCNREPANAILAEYYEKKRIGRPANVALCACMHKMMVYIFAVLRSRKPFELRSPEDHLEIMRNNALKMTA